MIAYFESQTGPAPGLMQRIKWRLDPQSRMQVQTKCVGAAAFWHACWPVWQQASQEELERQAIQGLELLRRQGAHRVAAEPRWRAAIQKTGMAAVTEDRLWPAAGFQVVMAELKARGAEPDKTWVCIAARRADRDVVRCARALAGKVRYLTIQAQAGEDYLAEMLYQDFGIARQTSAPPEYARLLVAFPGAEKQDGIALEPGGCPGLHLLAPAWAGSQKPSTMPDELYAAMLLENGLIRPQDVGAQIVGRRRQA